MHGTKNENVTGDNLNFCKDSFDCFDAQKLKDCRYCTNMTRASNDCYDIDIVGEISRGYNSACIGLGTDNIMGCYYVALGASNIFYSVFCWRNVANLFGCVGLSQKSYCILNKQYSPDEYQKLANKIKQHMKETGEWGEFFPPNFSMFGYNETAAQIYFPLTKEQAEKQGFSWYAETEKAPQKPFPVPESIHETDESICQEVLSCESCKKSYKIVPQELKLLKRLDHPAPTKCFMCRHKARFALRNPRKLWPRKCQTDIQTSYSPDRPEVVYCEPCYLKEVY